MLEAIAVSAAISIIGVMIQMKNVEKIANEIARETAKQIIKKAIQDYKSTDRHKN